jgi:hypothetical protein
VLEGMHQNRADLGARLGTRHTPQFLLQHRGDQHRTVGADGEVLQEVLFREVGNRGQRDCGDWGHRHEGSSLPAGRFRRRGNFEGVEETADRVVNAGQDDDVDNSGVSERFSGLDKGSIVDAVGSGEFLGKAVGDLFLVAQRDGKSAGGKATNGVVGDPQWRATAECA